MLNDLPCGTRVYLVTGYTDLRRSIDGLAAIVQGQLRLDGVTASKDFSGKETDSCCFTSVLITADSSGLETKQKQSF